MILQAKKNKNEEEMRVTTKIAPYPLLNGMYKMCAHSQTSTEKEAQVENH